MVSKKFLILFFLCFSRLCFATEELLGEREAVKPAPSASLPNPSDNRNDDDDESHYPRELPFQPLYYSSSESRQVPPGTITSTRSVFIECQKLFQRHQKGTLLLDIDGTVIGEKEDENKDCLLEKGLPLLLEKMRRAGWRICFFTARPLECSEDTRTQLRNLGLLANCPYQTKSEGNFIHGIYYTSGLEKGNNIGELLAIIGRLENNPIDPNEPIAFFDNASHMLSSVYDANKLIKLFYMIGNNPY